MIALEYTFDCEFVPLRKIYYKNKHTADIDTLLLVKTVHHCLLTVFVYTDKSSAWVFLFQAVQAY